MEPMLQITPLAVLLVGAVALVWRGLRTKPDRNAESHSSTIDDT